MTHLMKLSLLSVFLVGGIGTEALAKEPDAVRSYLIGNSLTWDTQPPLLSGDVQ